MDLSKKTSTKIDQLITHYPDKRSCVLPILHIIQDELGYISQDAMVWLAAKLDLQPIHIYEVVTFYPMLRQQKVGKKHIKVCRTLSCALRGSHQTCSVLQNELNCSLNHTSDNGEYTIEFVECLASCGTAPVVQVNETLYENCTPDKALHLVSELKKH